MAKKVTGYIKLQIPAGKATPAPPVGPALGDLSRNLKYRRLLRISDKLYRKPTQSLKNEKYLSHCYVPRGKDEPVAFPYCVKWG